MAEFYRKKLVRYNNGKKIESAPKATRYMANEIVNLLVGHLVPAAHGLF
jgi:hypothetical protein